MYSRDVRAADICVSSSHFKRLGRSAKLATRSVEAYRDPDTSPGDLTVFDALRVSFEMWGITPEHAEGLVETWKRRCPLYGSVVTATEDTSVTLTSHAEPRGARA